MIMLMVVIMHTCMHALLIDYVIHGLHDVNASIDQVGGVSDDSSLVLGVDPVRGHDPCLPHVWHLGHPHTSGQAQGQCYGQRECDHPRE